LTVRKKTEKDYIIKDFWNQKRDVLKQSELTLSCFSKSVILRKTGSLDIQGFHAPFIVPRKC